MPVAPINMIRFASCMVFFDDADDGYASALICLMVLPEQSVLLIAAAFFLSISMNGCRAEDGACMPCGLFMIPLSALECGAIFV